MLCKSRFISGNKSIEPRALNLYVKEEKKEQLFGTGIPHRNVDAMIGNYPAIAVTDLTIFNTIEEALEIVGVHEGKSGIRNQRCWNSLYSPDIKD